MKRPEQLLHQACVEYARLVLDDSVIFFHPPNGGGRSKVEGAILKTMGVLAGVPDLVFIWGGEMGAIVGFVEFKSEKGSLTTSQKVFRDKCGGIGGVFWSECRTLDEFILILSKWRIPPKGGRNGKQGA